RLERGGALRGERDADAERPADEAPYADEDEAEGGGKRDVVEADPHELLSRADGILIPGGFGGRGIEGKIAAAGVARERRIPYLGICLGMQVAVAEFARNVAGME